jgi:hypothetical protein
MEILRKKSWSPYVVGAAIGVLSWFAFFTADHPIGITTAFENSAALVVKSAAPQTVSEYLNKKDQEGKPPKIDWEWMLVVGVFIGSLLSAKLSGESTTESVPKQWSARFGPGTGLRFTAAFLGGAIMMFGARIAQGCTSGHGISGALQLAVSSWLFVLVFFITAVVFSMLLYGRR